MKKSAFFRGAALMIVSIVFAAIVTSPAYGLDYGLDVKIYGGAYGDGIHDDRVAIQNTIDQVYAVIQSNPSYTSGIVYFPAGAYRISTTAFPARASTVFSKIMVNCLVAGDNIAPGATAVSQ